MLRFFGGSGDGGPRGGLGLLTSKDWQPFPQTLRARTAHGSLFKRGQATVALIVNLANTSDTATLDVSAHGGWQWWDCLRGIPLTPSAGEDVTVTTSVEPQGIGCVFGALAEPAGLGSYLQKMAKMTQKPLSGLSREWHFLQQTRLNQSRTVGRGRPEEDMVRVPAARFHFNSSGVEDEGTDAEGVGEQVTGRDHRRLTTMMMMRI